VNHATTRVLTKKRTDNAISAGGNKASNFNNQNIGLNNYTSTLASRPRITGTSVGTSNSVVAAAISAAAAVAAMSGPGIVNNHTLNGLCHLPSLHSSNLSGNNLILNQNKSSLSPLTSSTISTVTSTSIPSLSSSVSSSSSSAALVSLLKAQHQQQNLAAAATAVALQQHNQLNGTNSQNTQALLAALMLQNLNNPNQLIKQSLSSLKYPQCTLYDIPIVQIWRHEIVILATAPFLAPNLNFPTPQIALPLINHSNNGQNLNLFTSSSSPSSLSSSTPTSIGSSIQLGTNLDLNSNETKLWLASLIGNSNSCIQSDLGIANNSLTNQIYQMYKSNANLNDTTNTTTTNNNNSNTLMKVNSLSKTQLNINENKTSSSNTLTDTTNTGISQIHDSRNKNNEHTLT
ncbi:unnamed protein product, partial [Schistosoma mattheei]